LIEAALSFAAAMETLGLADKQVVETILRITQEYEKKARGCPGHAPDT
jgi:hypothetical protein